MTILAIIAPTNRVIPLAAVAPGVTRDYGLDDIAGWELLPTTEAGDAQAQAVADVLSHPDLGFSSAANFKLLDTYTISQAVEDGRTVPIYYEARLARIQLPEDKKPEVDEEFEELTQEQLDLATRIWENTPWK